MQSSHRCRYCGGLLLCFTMRMWLKKDCLPCGSLETYTRETHHKDTHTLPHTHKHTHTHMQESCGGYVRTTHCFGCSPSILSHTPQMELLGNHSYHHPQYSQADCYNAVARFSASLPLFLVPSSFSSLSLRFCPSVCILSTVSNRLRIQFQALCIHFHLLDIPVQYITF